MKCFVLTASVALLLIPGVAFAYLSQNDEIALTRNLETLSAGTSEAAASSADHILLNSVYNADDWENYFNKFFTCSPSCAPNSASEHYFTNVLFNYLVNSIITDKSADIPNVNLQLGLINPLWSKINIITSVHPEDLGSAMFNNPVLWQTLFNGHRFLALFAEKGALDLTSRTNIYFKYKIYIKSYPQYFSDTTTIDFFAQPFVASLRAQVWMSFREALPMTRDLAREIATTIGLGQAVGSAKKLDIWNDISSKPLFVDNNGLDSTQLSVIYDILKGIPSGLHDLKYYMIDSFLYQASGWKIIMSKGDIINYNLSITPDNTIQFAFHNTRRRLESFATKTPLKSAVWNHVAVTFDGNQVVMYINGLLDARYTSTGLPNAGSTEPLELARQISQSLWLMGKLDEVKIYSRALFASEISDEYNNQPVSTAKLVAYYKMDESNGIFVKDSQGLGNSGTNFRATIVPGKINNGLFFNGKNAYVNIPDNPSLRLDGPMTLEAWVYFMDIGDWIRQLIPVAGNISGLKVGEVTEDPFPSDIAPIYVDTFSEVAVHEFNHEVDYFISNANLKMDDRKKQLIRQAGTEPLQYLRSMYVNTDGTSVFTQGPQEFFASISNQYFADTWHSFDLAIQRFNNGYKEPINQFLFFADVYSKGQLTTKAYTLNKKGALTVDDVPIRRGLFGNITEITRMSTNTIYQFILDFNGNVLFYTTTPMTKPKIVNKN